MTLHMQIANLKRQLEEQRKTLRDEFAMAALTGFLSHPDAGFNVESSAQVAFQYADAMLEARK
jgi:hypothetical protein